VARPAVVLFFVAVVAIAIVGCAPLRAVRAPVAV